MQGVLSSSLLALLIAGPILVAAFTVQPSVLRSHVGQLRGSPISGSSCAAGIYSLPTACRRSKVRSGLAGLRAQMNPALPPDDDTKKIPLNWETIKKQADLFGRMAAPYFREEKSARLLLAIVIGFTLANSGISVGFSYISRDFWTALNQKDPEKFYPLLRNFALALAGGTPVSVLYKFYREKLSLQWRDWMTKRIMNMFETDRSYYVLEMGKEIDNPDQRIAEDIRAFTSVSLAFSITILTSVIDLASFSSILYSIYPELFGAIILYATFGTACTFYLGNKLVELNYAQLQREADFRFSLVRMRENAESIAFYGGENTEMKEIKKRLDLTIENIFQVMGVQRNLETFTVGYRYMVQVIPAWVVAPLYFKGKIELGVVSQSYGAFNHILSDLSILVNQFEGISSFAAGIGRLGDFVEAMEKSQQKQEYLRHEEHGQISKDSKGNWDETTWWNAFTKAISINGIAEANPAAASTVMQMAFREVLPFMDNGASHANGVPDANAASHKAEHTISDGNAFSKAAAMGEIRSTIKPGCVLEVKDMTLQTPDRARTLVKNLNLKMDPGQHLLIVGNSGAGKSSVLRAVAGLWSAGSGEIIRPPPGETFFLPQRPYCTLGSLREQLLYPNRPGENSVDYSDEQLLEILQQVKLPSLAKRLAEQEGGNGLDSKRDWSSMLSLGEQQRLAFGRLLANRPKLAILDEASSALDLDSERYMYQLLDEVEGLTYISVGHRPSLLQYHDSKLKLSEDGYDLETIDQEKEARAANIGPKLT